MKSSSDMLSLILTKVMCDTHATAQSIQSADSVL